MAHGDNTLRVGLSTPVAEYDVHQASDATSHLVLAQVFEAPYFQASPASPPEPRVMDGLLEMVKGGDITEYQARIWPGLQFSDGSPVEPDHVIASLEGVRPVQSMARLSRRGDHVVFTLNRPIPHFEFQLSKRWCAILKQTDQGQLGTGPFMLGSERSEEFVRLVRNPHYRGPVALEAIEFRVYPPDARGKHDALVAALESGELDFSFAVPRDEVGQISGVRKLFQPGNSTAMLYLNCERGAFQDPSLRKAVTRGIDRYELARVCYPDSPGLSARGLLPPDMGSNADGLRHDPSEAKAALEAAKVDRPETLRMVTVWGPRPYVPKPAVVIEELRRQFGGLGMKLDVTESSDPSDYFNKLEGGEYDLVLGGWIADTEDPADFLEAVLATDFIPIPGRPTALTANLSRWDDADTNQLIRSYREAPSAENLQAVLDRVTASDVLLPLMYGPRVVVHARRVRGFDATPVYVPSFASCEVD